MSHKLPGPPNGPFAGVTVIVDKNSTSSTEDGTWANPYKTIQAALDNAPVPTDEYEAFIGCLVRVMSGLYEETLTVPKGNFFIRGEGFVSLGTGTPAHDILHPAVEGFFAGVTVILRVEQVSISGRLILTGGSVFGVLVGLVDVGVYDEVDALGWTQPTASSLSLLRGSVSNAVTVNGALISDACSAGGGMAGTNVILKNLSTNTVTASGQLAEMDNVQCFAVTAGSAGHIRNCHIQENCALGSVVQEVVATGVVGNFTCQTPRVFSRVEVGGSTTVTDAPTIYDSILLGGYTINGPAASNNYNSTFNNGVTVTGTNQRFFGCYLTGNFIGPAGSYLPDGTTIARSTVVLVPPATLDPIVVEPVVELPSTFDNTLPQYALMSVASGDPGWAGNDRFVIIDDGVSSDFVEVADNGGSAPTDTMYDAGGGLGWDPAVFGNVVSLNSIAMRPVWQKLDLVWDGANFVPNMGTVLYLAHTHNTHNTIDVRACNTFKIGNIDVADLDHDVNIGSTVFVAVAGSADAESKEFNDVTGSTEAACAASLADAINSVAGRAAINADLGFPITATAVTGLSDEFVVLDSGGLNCTLTGATNIAVGEWDDIATAIVLTPGTDMS